MRSVIRTAYSNLDPLTIAAHVAAVGLTLGCLIGKNWAGAVALVVALAALMVGRYHAILRAESRAAQRALQDALDHATMQNELLHHLRDSDQQAYTRMAHELSESVDHVADLQKRLANRSPSHD